MENHPIPQDVTGFKFKLIGSVTVKQFLYILGGGILAVVILMIPVSFFIKIPIAVVIGSIGAAIAFLPIEGRPMDVMAKNFIKALPAENQFIYKRRGADLLITEFFTPKTASVKPIEEKKSETDSASTKRALVYGAIRRTYKPEGKEEALLSNINSYLHDETPKPVMPTVQNADAMPVNKATQIAAPVSFHHTDIKEGVKVVIPKSDETPITKPAPTTQGGDKGPVFEARAPMPSIDSLNKAVNSPQTSTQDPQNQAFEVGDVKVVRSITPPTPQVQKAPEQNIPNPTLKAGFPSLPDAPNVVMGIVKDPRGKILPNILVEIMDSAKIPVRAFKTNALGQFAAATPLPNGEFDIFLEDPRKQNEFSPIHIKLEGAIFEPLEILSVDQREKLRRELFGAGQVRV